MPEPLAPPTTPGPRIVAVGELLWDRLPSGDRPGGAPANFAWHCARLGARVTLVSRVGRDAAGERLLARLAEARIDPAQVQRDAEAPTGSVDVATDATGLPHYTIRTDVAWDRIETSADAHAAAARCDAICWGTLAQRATVSRATIRALVAATPATALRVFDVNLRQPFWSAACLDESLAAADVLKLNDEELPVVARALGVTGGDADAQLDALLVRYDLALAALTRGAHGCVLRAPDARVEHPGVPARVVDTVGAGDAFTAALVVGLLGRTPLDEIARRANAHAAWVVGAAGAWPEGPPPS